MRSEFYPMAGFGRGGVECYGSDAECRKILLSTSAHAAILSHTNDADV